MPWRRVLQRAWQAVVWTGLALLGLLVLAWLTLQWGILPHIDDWRPAIERHASRAVGVPVRIGRIAVRSSGWIPAFELRDVVLRDASGAEALRLPLVSAAVSPRSLFALEPRLSQLYIDGARLLVRRDAAGHLHVGGLDLAARATASASVDESNGTLDWFFSQPEFVLRHGAVRWVDEQRAAPALELTDVDVVVRNGLRSHDLRIDATPPADWGDRLQLLARCRQPLFARAGDLRRWSGTLYADLPRGDVAQLERHVDLPFELDRGRGALRLWLDFRDDQWREATADVRLADVGLRLGDGLEPLAIASASGRLRAQRDAAGVSVAAEHFGFRTAGGLAWPVGDLRFAWTQAQRSVAATRGARASEVAGAKANAPNGGAASPASIARADTASAGPAASVATRRPASAPMLFDRDAPVTGGELSADHLDLALMRQLAAALPLPATARRWLADYRPDGVVSQLALRWSGPVDAPASYRANGAIAGFAIAAGAVAPGARTGRPGWRNARLDFDASESGGVAHVALDGGAIELPGVFADPLIPFTHFGAVAHWTVEPARDGALPPTIALQLQDVHFENADAQGELRLQWHTGPTAAPNSTATLVTGDVAAARTAQRASAAPPAFGRGQRWPGQLDLQGELRHANAAKLARYLPLTVGAKTRDYIAHAFTGGDMTGVAFTVRGDLAGVPYARQHDGEFRIAGHVSNVDLDYVPGALADDGTRAVSQWPAFTQVQGDIVLDRGALEIRNAAGRRGQLALQNVHGTIATLYDAPVLALQGNVAGPMPDFLRYVAQSPVGGWLHDGLARATATGDANLDLALNIPLQGASATTVDGAFTLAGDEVRIVPAAPLFANAHARFDFTEHGMSVKGGTASLLGGAATFDGGTLADGGLRFDAHGDASADGLRHVADEAMLVRLASHLSGQTSYKLRIDIAKGETGFALSSPMTGLGLALPAPLDKPADAIWPLRVSSTVSFDAQGRPRDTLRVDLARPQGPVLAASVLRDLSGPVPRPLLSAYAVGAPLPAPLPGGILLLQGAAFDGDAWMAFWRGLSAPAPALESGAPGAVAAASAAPVYAPTAAALATPDLLIGGHHFTHVDVQLAQVIAGGEEIWRSNVGSDQTKGVVEYRPGTAARGAELFARLDRLSIGSRDAEPTADKVANDASPSPSTATLPALDVVVDNFELNGRKLGRLEAAATLQSGARDWRLTKLSMTTPEATFTGSGRWSDGPVRRMALDFRLDLADSGAFLDRFGIGHALKGGKGRLAGSVAWAGSPLAIDYPSLDGKLQIALDEGQFLKVDAGAGRLLGVLSLQSLPRRLSLDFRDLFDEGFAFDNITGDVTIAKGVATTRDLRMRSVGAAVLMSGHADLKAETQDLDVIIVPEINAGAASLAYAAINPVIGIGTFLAQLFLRSPLAEAGTREFHVSGTWSAPKVDPVEHKAAVAAAAQAASQARAAEAEQAASAPTTR